LKAAYTLQELNLLLEGESLDGIKVVDEQRANVQKVGKRRSLNVSASPSVELSPKALLLTVFI
jgi:hypothetical protein